MAGCARSAELRLLGWPPRAVRMGLLLLWLSCVSCNAILGMDERQPYPPGTGGSGGTTTTGSGGTHVGGGGTGGTAVGGGGQGGSGGDPCASPVAPNLCLPREGCLSADHCSDVALLLHFDQLAAYGETDQLAHDFSGNGNDATCETTTCPTTAPWGGRFGGAFEYSHNDHFSVPNDSSLSFPDEVTVSVWFYPRQYPSQWRAIVAKVVQGTEDANFWIGHDDDRFCALYHSEGAWHLGCTSVGYPVDQWYNLVGTWDDPNDTFRLYINGDLATEDTASTADVPEVATPVTIGWAPGDSGVEGLIDEVVIWNRLLSPTEISALYVP